MRMEADRVVAVWVFAGIEQRFDDFDVAELRGQGKRSVAIIRGCEGKQSQEAFGAA